MTSYQIEVASSSSPFGNVLRPSSSLRDRWINRDSKSNVAAFHDFRSFVESFSGHSKKKPSSGDDSASNDSKGEDQKDDDSASNDSDDCNSSKGVEENDVENKNVKKNGKKIDHAELFVHVPTYMKNDEKFGKEKTEIVSFNVCMKGSTSAPLTPVKSRAVSSLVRRWRDFEAEAKNSSTNKNSSPNSPMTSRSNSVKSLECNKTYNNSTTSENGDNEPCVETRMNEDACGDQEPDDIEKEKEKEKEKTRVKKLIHKLTEGTNDENGNGCEAITSPTSMGSPRLRGRQAFGDLLMVMQRDRLKELDVIVERKPVSRFSQKGRIQAMLRVQLLRGALEPKDARKPNGRSLEVNRLPQSSIRRLSEMFKPVSQDSATEVKSLKKEVSDSSKSEKSEVKSLKKEVSDSSKAEKSISVQDSKCTHQQEVEVPSTTRKEAENNENKEIMLTSCIVEEKKTEEENILSTASSGNPHEDACSEASFSTYDNKHRLQSSDVEVDLHEKQQQQRNEIIDHQRNESVETQGECCEDVLSNQYLTESEHGWVSDVSHTQAGWEELHSDYERQSEGFQDWICDVSRPRSEWEDLRQERYLEMLDPFQKEDIRRLLESKSVSNFLSSGLRDHIDRLMISRTQQLSSRTGSQTDEQYVGVEAEEEKFEFRVEREPEVEEDAIEEDEGGDAGYNEDEEDDEDEIEVKQQYEESVEYADQTPPSLPFASCNTTHDPRASDSSEQVGFSHSPTTNQCSIEMQLIYELKGHMEQLHKEVSEIRKSMKTCINMQHKLRRSVKHDVISAISQSGQNRGRHSTQKKGQISKNMCCICYNVQVDSLLYRCGHMCTCFKCAHKLQQGSGKCPVCQAPIFDVVRAHASS